VPDPEEAIAQPYPAVTSRSSAGPQPVREEGDPKQSKQVAVELLPIGDDADSCQDLEPCLARAIAAARAGVILVRLRRLLRG
jgi:hypothetical protein